MGGAAIDIAEVNRMLQLVIGVGITSCIAVYAIHTVIYSCLIDSDGSIGRISAISGGRRRTSSGDAAKTPIRVVFIVIETSETVSTYACAAEARSIQRSHSGSAGQLHLVLHMATIAQSIESDHPCGATSAVACVAVRNVDSLAGAGQVNDRTRGLNRIGGGVGCYFGGVGIVEVANGVTVVEAPLDGGRMTRCQLRLVVNTIDNNASVGNDIIHESSGDDIAVDGQLTINDIDASVGATGQRQTTDTGYRITSAMLIGGAIAAHLHTIFFHDNRQAIRAVHTEVASLHHCSGVPADMLGGSLSSARGNDSVIAHDGVVEDDSVMVVDGVVGYDGVPKDHRIMLNHDGGIIVNNDTVPITGGDSGIAMLAETINRHTTVGLVKTSLERLVVTSVCLGNTAAEVDRIVDATEGGKSLLDFIADEA